MSFNVAYTLTNIRWAIPTSICFLRILCLWFWCMSEQLLQELLLLFTLTYVKQHSTLL